MFHFVWSFKRVRFIKKFLLQKGRQNKGFELYLLENGIINSDHLSFFESKSIDFVFFHGSVGDRSFKDGISDVDVVIGFNQKLIKSYNSFSEFILKLYNYNFHLFKVDSLQHHGILSFFNFQTTSYFKHYLPEELIKHGETLKAKFSPSSVESKRLEKNALKTMINDSIELNRRIFLGNYKQKALYSTILMIYIYKIQLVEGVYGFKPHILDLVYKNSNITEKTILDKLSFFRLNFKYKSKISGILKYFTDYPLFYKYLLIFEGTFRYFFSKRILFHLKNRGEFEFFLIGTSNELELIDG